MASRASFSRFAQTSLGFPISKQPEPYTSATRIVVFGCLGYYVYRSIGISKRRLWKGSHSMVHRNLIIIFAGMFLTAGCTALAPPVPPTPVSVTTRLPRDHSCTLLGSVSSERGVSMPSNVGLRGNERETRSQVYADLKAQAREIGANWVQLDSNYYNNGNGYGGANFYSESGNAYDCVLKKSDPNQTSP